MVATIIILVTLALTAYIIFKRKDKIITGPANNQNLYIPGLIFPLMVLIFGITFAIVNPFKLERVDTGHIGIKINLTGDDRGVSEYKYKTGWVVYNSWTHQLKEMATHQKHVEYANVQVITKGGFPADIKPSFNYAIIPTAAGDLFQNLRLELDEIEATWLKTAVIGAINDIANKWAVDSIFNFREQFESEIVSECNKRVSKWFNVSQLRTNIVPPGPLQEAIIAKTKALQEVQVAENKKLAAVADALRKIAIARGDSAEMVIQAAGEAEAIRRKQVSLTDNYIKYFTVEKWDGKNSLYNLGGNTATMINVK